MEFPEPQDKSRSGTRRTNDSWWNFFDAATQFRKSLNLKLCMFNISAVVLIAGDFRRPLAPGGPGTVPVRLAGIAALPPRGNCDTWRFGARGGYKIPAVSSQFALLFEMELSVVTLLKYAASTKVRSSTVSGNCRPMCLPLSMNSAISCARAGFMLLTWGWETAMAPRLSGW